MWEQSKGAKRTFYDGLFHARYFVGNGIDIGGGPDPLGQYTGVFARMGAARTMDLEDDDAQVMAGIPGDEFGFGHSSHRPEHLREPDAGLLEMGPVGPPRGVVVVTT